MERTAILITLAAFFLGALGGKAHATYSGLIYVPSTDIQSSGEIHLDVDTFFASGPNPATVYGLLFGSGRFEYGVDYVQGENDPVYLNAKMLLRDETSSAPSIAVGMYGIGSKSDVSSNIIYLLGSKEFAAGRATFGYGLGRKNVLGGDNGMVMLGFDRALSDKWWAAIDYQSGKSELGALSAGIEYAFGDGKSAILAYNWFNDRSISNTFGIQLDFDFR